MTHAELKKHILGHIEDAVLDFMVYDRKDDEDLPRGMIEDAVSMGIVSLDDIVQTFKTCMESHLR